MSPNSGKKSAKKPTKGAPGNHNKQKVKVSCKEAVAFGAAVVASSSITLGFGAGKRYAEHLEQTRDKALYSEPKKVCDTVSGQLRDTREPRPTEIDKPHLCKVIEVCKRKTPDDITYVKLGRIILAQYDPELHSLNLAKCNPAPTS